MITLVLCSKCSSALRPRWQWLGLPLLISHTLQACRLAKPMWGWKIHGRFSRSGITQPSLCKENDGPESLMGCPPKHGCQTIKEEVMLSYLGTWVLPG